MRSRVIWLATLTVSVGLIYAQAPSNGNNTLTAVPGIKVGHFTLAQRPTGCTVILAEAGATAGVDVRGAAPATRETDLLRPQHLQMRTRDRFRQPLALRARYGRRRRASQEKRMFEFGNRTCRCPPGGALRSLSVGDGTIRPTADCGYQAARMASTAPAQEGSIGAGAGATIGKSNGVDHAMKGGIGTAAVTLPNGLTVAALVATNGFGDLVDPATGAVVAGVRAADGKTLIDARKLLRHGDIRFAAAGRNTTLGIVATNAVLTKTEATRVAEMAHDGFARAIVPVHTPVDGDAIFALATGSRTGAADVGQIGALAAA